MSVSQLLTDKYPTGVLQSNLLYSSITVANTSVTAYTPSTGKKFFPVQLSAFRASGNPSGTLAVGNSNPFVQKMPLLNFLAGQINTYTLEDGLPLTLFENPCIIQASNAAVAANDVQVLLTVWEF